MIDPSVEPNPVDGIDGVPASFAAPGVGRAPLVVGGSVGAFAGTSVPLEPAPCPVVLLGCGAPGAALVPFTIADKSCAVVGALACVGATLGSVTPESYNGCGFPLASYVMPTIFPMLVTVPGAW